MHSWDSAAAGIVPRFEGAMDVLELLLTDAKMDKMYRLSQESSVKSGRCVDEGLVGRQRMNEKIS